MPSLKEGRLQNSQFISLKISKKKRESERLTRAKRASLTRPTGLWIKKTLNHPLT